MNILVLNAGSSSQKSCLYEITDSLPAQAPQPLWEGQINWTQDSEKAEIKVKTATGQILEKTLFNKSPNTQFTELLSTLTDGNTQVINNLSEIDIVGHRVVHGGQHYHHTVLITAEVKQAIADLAHLAPAHNPAALAGIQAIEETLGSIPQIAVFDTAFHSTIPDAAAIYPIPYHLVEEGIRRYGFHGISHQYCANRAAEILNQNVTSLKIVTCHLGNGASLAAIKNGESIDTTMGFTPLDGLMMGNRSGSVDPGILIYLVKQYNYTGEELDNILNKQSGLKGISGISSDMREIIAAKKQGNKRAQLAWDIYIHRLKANIGAMVASLGGIDVLIFTAGIGEKSAELREATCENLGYLGIKIDIDKNRQQPIDNDIATIDSQVRILVIKTQEDWAIAVSSWAESQKNL